MKYQFMPMFWGDLLANTLHLSTLEVGAYTLLIAHAWEHQAKVPAKRAQHIARVSNFQWGKIKHSMSQFFDTSTDANNWIHERVKIELDRAAEISMKRKGAAMQKQSKSSANDTHLHLQLPTDNLNLSEEGKAPIVQMHRPQPTADWHPRIDEADDYRSPPRQKSDNVLQPIPERPKR